MNIFNIEPITAAILLGMIAGVVEFIKHLFAAISNKSKNDWRACAIIAGAGITGALVAIPLGIDILMGAVVGFAASGYITIVQNIGKEVA